MECGVPGNVKVELPKTGEETSFYGEWLEDHNFRRERYCVAGADDESGSDEEFLDREVMKRATTALVEAKTKKKTADDDEDEGTTKKRKRR